MRKFISPIINILSIILVGIAFGLAGITAAYDASDVSIGNYYQIVWQNINVFNLIGFFAICVGAFLLLLVFIPKIVRLISSLLSGGLLIAGGCMALMAPAKVQGASALPVTNQGGLIGMAVLLFIAGGFSLIIFLLEILGKKEN